MRRLFLIFVASFLIVPGFFAQDVKMIDSLFRESDVVVQGYVMSCEPAYWTETNFTGDASMTLRIWPSLCFSKTNISPELVGWQKEQFSPRRFKTHFGAKEAEELVIDYQVSFNGSWYIFQRNQSFIFFLKRNSDGQFELEGTSPRLISPDWEHPPLPYRAILNTQENVDHISALAEKKKWFAWKYECRESVNRFTKTLILNQRLFNPFTNQVYLETVTWCKISKDESMTDHGFYGPRYIMHPLKSVTTYYDSLSKKKCTVSHLFFAEPTKSSYNCYVRTELIRHSDPSCATVIFTTKAVHDSVYNIHDERIELWEYREKNGRYPMKEKNGAIFLPGKYDKIEDNWETPKAYIRDGERYKSELSQLANKEQYTRFLKGAGTQ